MTDRAAIDVIPGGGPIADVPAELRALPRWVGWRYIVDRETGKTSVFPVSPVTRRGASHSDPATWGTFEAALALIESENCEGVSCAVAPPYAVLDLDDVIDPDTGAIDQDAGATIERFNSYWQLSHSREGVHIWIKGTLAHLTGRKRGDRECYDERRFMRFTALTGGGQIEERQAVLDEWHAEVFPARPGPHTYTGPSRPLDLSDTEILGKIGRSKQAIKFGRLWAGNTDDYKSGSEADLALCSMLAFWCQKDAGKVDRMFRSSGLMRAKWDARRSGSTYGKNTIETAIANGGSYDPDYSRPAAPSANGNGKHVPRNERGDSGNEATVPRNDLPQNGNNQALPLTLYRDVVASLDAADFVEGLLIDGTMSVVYGESNCGKTFFVLDLALHIAAGLSWRGKAIDQRGVLYLALEGGFGVRNRIAAFKATHPEIADLPFALVPVSLNLLGPEGDTVRVVEAAQEAAARLLVPVGLVVVDTLSRAMSGGNENAPEDMTALIAQIDLIRAHLRAHVVVVHHSGKDVARGARGHSSLRAATDTEIEVTRDLGTKTSTARVTKQRDLECSGEFGFKLEPVHLGNDRRGKPVHSCVVRPAVPVGPVGQAPPRADQLAVEDQAVLLAVDREVTGGAAGATITRIREHTGYGQTRAKRIVDRLVAGQRLEFVEWDKEVGNGAIQSAEGWRKVPD